MSETPTETIRRAAALMRKRAKHADTGEPWEADVHCDALFTVDLKPSIGPVKGPEDPKNHLDWASWDAPRFLMARHEHAEHIASWHPIAAAAFADLLEAAACLSAPPWGSPVTRAALKAARAYLGEAL